MNDNITELGNHDPTVESVITRLYNNMDKIKSITAVVKWEDESSGVYYDTKCTSQMAFESVVLQKYILTEMFENID